MKESIHSIWDLEDVKSFFIFLFFYIKVRLADSYIIYCLLLIIKLIFVQLGRLYEFFFEK